MINTILSIYFPTNVNFKIRVLSFTKRRQKYDRNVRKTAKIYHVSKIFFQMIAVLMIVSSSRRVKAMENSQVHEPIKVGFYESYPFYYLDNSGKIRGYYHELMELFAQHLNLDYEYVKVSVDDSLNKLHDHEIDLLFGVGMSSQRHDEYIYSKYYIAHDKESIVTSQPIQFGELNALNGLTFGYINNTISYDQLLMYLQQEEININVKETDSIENLRYLMENNEIDFTITSVLDETFNSFNQIYEFFSGPLYIATYNGGEPLMQQIDSYFEANSDAGTQLEEVYATYFNEYKIFAQLYLITLVIVCLAIGVAMIRMTINQVEEICRKKQWLNHLKKEHFMLYYQPIIDPNRNQIMSCEALLRFNDGEKVLPPIVFLDELEAHDLMKNVTLWVLRQVINDYHEIKKSDLELNDEFYISMNVSFNELKNSGFIRQVKDILADVDLKKVKLCFEIVEKYRLQDQELMNQVISDFRALGITIAIDDFGVEYANLDMLDAIEYDIVKLDKHFIDTLQSSFIAKESILFIGKIIKYYHKSLVIEGVEVIEQLKMIQELNQGLFYIQGYFYSKPLCLDELKQFKLVNSDVCVN